jgi:hypothetical protein
MAANQTLAQLCCETIEVNAAVEVTEGGGGTVRTGATLTDRMALGAHAFR